MHVKLTKISELSELKSLQELYLKDWPKHCVGYFWLDNYIRWQKKVTLKHLTFYTLQNDWRSDGLFILVHRYQLFFSNLSREKTPQLREALELLDWSVGYKVSAIHETHNNVYKQLVLERQLCLEREMNTKFYSMPCEKAKLLKISCPSGYYLDKVRLEHAVLINELWPARHAGSLKLIELLIEHNTSIGLYEQETGQLCAWCLRLQSGFLGALQVLETHQRRGFAAVVAAAISHKIAKELEQDVTALVSMDNAPAARVFEKLHFTLNAGEHYYWSMCLPHKGDTINWPDKQ